MAKVLKYATCPCEIAVHSRFRSSICSQSFCLFALSFVYTSLFAYSLSLQFMFISSVYIYYLSYVKHLRLQLQFVHAHLTHRLNKIFVNVINQRFIVSVLIPGTINQIFKIPSQMKFLSVLISQLLNNPHQTLLTISRLTDTIAV